MKTVLTYLYTCKDVVVLCGVMWCNTLNTLTIKALMTGLRGFSGWVSPVQCVRRIRWWRHLVTGIKRTVVIWPGSSNDQMRRYLPRPPSKIQDNMSSMFSSIVRHKRQVFTFQFEPWVYWVYVLQHLHSEGRIPPTHSDVGGLWNCSSPVSFDLFSK